MIYSIYKFYQSTVPKSKEIQNIIKIKYTLPIIEINFINDNINSTKDFFINVCNTVIKIRNNYSEDNNISELLKKAILNNNIYSEDIIKYFIPVRFGNNDIKFNKLIFKLLILFLEILMNKEINDKNEILLMDRKLLSFKSLQPFISKLNLFKSNDELFEVYDYLFNLFIFYIM